MNEGYPPTWWHCEIHLEPETGTMHSDGDHRVREWIEEKIKGVKVNYKMPTKEELWGIIKETFKNTNRYVIEGDNTTVGMVDFDELAQAILDRLKI